MYIAVRRYKVKAGTVEELASRAQQELVPLMRQAPGFVAYYGAMSGSNSLFTVSIFQDQAGADASTKFAVDWTGQNVAQYIEGTPEVMSGEVRWSS